MLYRRGRVWWFKFRVGGRVYRETTRTGRVIPLNQTAASALPTWAQQFPARPPPHATVLATYVRDSHERLLSCPRHSTHRP